jgi:hypothetical protein
VETDRHETSACVYGSRPGRLYPRRLGYNCRALRSVPDGLRRRFGLLERVRFPQLIPIRRRFSLRAVRACGPWERKLQIELHTHVMSNENTFPSKSESKRNAKPSETEKGEEKGNRHRAGSVSAGRRAP